MRYAYSYITESSFRPAVTWHFFKLRALPCCNEFQQVVTSQLVVEARRGEGAAGLSWPCALSHSTDGQGNVVQWGSVSEGHEALRVVSVGEAVQTQPYLIHEAPAPYYLTPTLLTACSPDMLAHRQQGPPFEVAASLMHAVHRRMSYVPCHTTVATTAAQAWADPRGVCQDYAHVMIALCRASGLHARYVSGCIEGEGQTHAWVEVSDGQVWRAFDPTHDTAICWGYLKIAHGRDANDCPTNRGRIYGCTLETMSVSVKLTIDK